MLNECKRDANDGSGCDWKTRGPATGAAAAYLTKSARLSIIGGRAPKKRKGQQKPLMTRADTFSSLIDRPVVVDTSAPFFLFLIFSPFLFAFPTLLRPFWKRQRRQQRINGEDDEQAEIRLAEQRPHNSNNKTTTTATTTALTKNRFRFGPVKESTLMKDQVERH